MNLKRLFSLREYHDLTQADLAKLLGVSRESISTWETGREIIPLNKLNQYANYFDVSLDYILNLTDSKKHQHTKKDLDKVLIGQRIKEFRKKKQLTQQELAQILNTTHSTISAYESGKTLILTSFAYQIAKKYAISMDWLCGKN